jgi:hypothetical protein
MPLPVVAESDDLGGLPGRHLSRRIFRSVHKNRPQVTSHTDVTSDESKQQHAPNPCSPTCSARDINLGTPAIRAILETDLSHLQFNSWVRIQILASAFFDALECQIPPKPLDFSISCTAPAPDWMPFGPSALPYIACRDGRRIFQDASGLLSEKDRVDRLGRDAKSRSRSPTKATHFDVYPSTACAIIVIRS